LVFADGSLVGNLDTVSGVSRGSADSRGSRAWQVERSPSMSAVARHPDRLRPWLVLVEGVGLVVVAVLAAPTRKVRR
jgi:hypothetical protein